MDITKKTIYPENLEKGNYEFNILRILEENEYCVWQDFLDERLNMSPTTVSKYTRKLIEKGYIKKEKRKYKITTDGLNRIADLESIGEEKSFPPDDLELLPEEKIIWMVNVNPYCQWRDFMNERLEMNRSTLSKTLARLIRNDLLEKKIDSEISHYPIYVKKREAVRKYRAILNSKNLDPKTRQLEKLKMVREISHDNKQLFEEFDIHEFDIKHRFNKYKLIFDYLTYRQIFRDNEKHYNLTLLFLAINHPDNYPNYISLKDFCTNYDIKKTELDYYIGELLEPSYSSIKLFSLNINNEKSYFFHEKGKLAKILKALIQDYLDKKFQKTMEKEWRKYDYDIKIPLSYDELLEIVSIIIDKHAFLKQELRSSLLVFLPSFINYLEYKIEQKYEKLSKKKSSISREFEIIEYLKTSMDLTEIEHPKLKEERKLEISEEIDYIDKKTLDSLEKSKIKINSLIKENHYTEALKEINESLPIFEKVDEEIQFFELNKLSKINMEYYELRLFFYINKMKCLVKLRNFDDLLENAIITYDLDSISNVVIDLIEIEQYKIANDIYDKAFDPYNKLSGDDRNEAIGEFWWGIHSYFHNKIVDEFRNKTYENALTIINKYLNFSPNDEEMVELKIKAYFYLKEYEKAIEITDNAIKKWPKRPEHIKWKLTEEEKEEPIWALMLDKEKDKDKIESISYGYKFCHLKARILLNMKKYDESLEILEKIIKANPNISESYYLKSLIEYELNHSEQALELLNFAIDIDPNEDLYYGVKADFLFNFNKYSDALEVINKSIELNSRKPIYYNIKAKILLFMNKPNNALKVIDHAIQEFPEFSGFYKTKSLILSNQEKSLIALEKAEELGDKISYYNKAQTLYNLGRSDEALKAINIELNKNFDDPIGFELKAAILAELGRFDEAFNAYEKINEINADYAKITNIKSHIYNKMAYYFAEEGNQEEAVKAIKNAIEISPDSADYYDSYGEILMIFKDFKNAVEKFEKAKKLHFTPIETFIKLGKCLFELGKYEEALENLRIGRNRAVHTVKRVMSTEEDKRFIVDFPQTELIQEAEKYILEIKKIQDKK
ncbi:MAG: tetratricopeptide repeat protein [Promethearchaeota archaeon]